MAKHKLSKKGAITIILVAVFLVLLFLAYLAIDALLGFNYAALYSYKQHLARIEKRVQKYFMTDEYEYTSFEVYPLYDENDKMQYFLVEFEPAGFLYIKINERSNAIITFFGMYIVDVKYNSYHTSPWRRYRISNQPAVLQPNGTWIENEPYPDSGWEFDSNIKDRYYGPYIRWEVDVNGEFISYNKSHFEVANVKNERMYMVKSSYDRNEYIPAVKREDKWLNLVSMQEFIIGDYENAFTMVNGEYIIPNAKTYFNKKFDLNWN